MTHIRITLFTSVSYCLSSEKVRTSELFGYFSSARYQESNNQDSTMCRQTFIQETAACSLLMVQFDHRCISLINHKVTSLNKINLWLDLPCLKPMKWSREEIKFQYMFHLSLTFILCHRAWIVCGAYKGLSWCLNDQKFSRSKKCKLNSKWDITSHIWEWLS